MIPSPNATDTAEQRQADRKCYVEYQRAEVRMRQLARDWVALSQDVIEDSTLSTFAQGYAAEVRRRYEDLAVFSAEQAEVAAQTAATYRAHLGLVEDGRMSARPRCRSCGAHRHGGEPHREGCKPVGGGYCPCSGVTDFYTDQGREEWEQIHESCVEDVA